MFSRTAYNTLICAPFGKLDQHHTHRDACMQICPAKLKFSVATENQALLTPPAFGNTDLPDVYLQGDGSCRTTGSAQHTASSEQGSHVECGTRKCPTAGHAHSREISSHTLHVCQRSQSKRYMEKLQQSPTTPYCTIHIKDRHKYAAWQLSNLS